MDSLYTHYIPTHCRHAHPHNHAWTCVPTQAHVRALPTQICSSPTTNASGVISRCLIENKHSRLFKLADWNLPWTAAVWAAPTLALCHENRQHGSKRIQEAAFSICLFLVCVCVCVNAAVLCMRVRTVDRRSMHSNFWEGVDLECRLWIYRAYSYTGTGFLTVQAQPHGYTHTVSM